MIVGVGIFLGGAEARAAGYRIWCLGVICKIEEAVQTVMLSPWQGMMLLEGGLSEVPALVRRGVMRLGCAMVRRGRFVPQLRARPFSDSAFAFEASFVSAPLEAKDAEDAGGEAALMQALVSAEGSRGVEAAEARAQMAGMLDAWIDGFVIGVLSFGALQSRRVALASPGGPGRVLRPAGKELRFVFALLGEARVFEACSEDERAWALSLCAWSGHVRARWDWLGAGVEDPPGWSRAEPLRAWLLPAYEAAMEAAREEVRLGLNGS